MIERIYCLQCAMNNRLENNPKVMVMSINTPKYEANCYQCEKKIGHSDSLNRLYGIYHTYRHKINDKIYKSKLSMDNLHYRLMNLGINGNSLNCFVDMVRRNKYSDAYVTKWFYKLVKEEPFKTKIALLREILDISHKNHPPKLTAEDIREYLFGHIPISTL